MRTVRGRVRALGSRPREAGASAVEAALILPLMILLTFGFIETTTLLRDYAAVSHLARDGSRIASAYPRFGTVAGHAGTAGQTSFALKAAELVETSGTALPKSSIVDMWVYLANADGFPSQSLSWQSDTTSSFDGTCNPATCVRYAWDDGSGSFDYRSGTWDPATINACPADPDAMAVGVFIRVDHKSVTSIVPANMTITDRSVMKFEPMRPGPGSCKPATVP